MKFIELEKIFEKIPNKYLAIVLAAKEVRRVAELRKAAQAQAAENMAEGAMEEIKPVTNLEVTPKKRGRKSKKEISGMVETIKISSSEAPKPVSPSEPISEVDIEMGSDKMISAVAAEKSEENPYIAALKKILKKYDFTKPKDKTEAGKN